MEIKDIIINSLSMEQILKYYGIDVKGKQFCCPFHGDKSPSARAYSNTYYCFACNATGDLIQFVQDYLNLSFIDAMKKINYDFGLGIDFTYENKEELEKAKRIIEEKKEQKRKKKKEYNNKMLELCNKINKTDKLINRFRSIINPFNWENVIQAISLLEEEKEWLEIEFEQNLR